MVRERDTFAPLLKQFLCTNYEDLERSPDDPSNPEPRNPLILFDRHIAPTLLLKTIRHAPWIPKELAKICEQTISDFNTAGHAFVENSEYWNKFQGYPFHRRSCADVAEYHFRRIGNPCNAYASKLLFHPNDPTWFSFIVSRRDLSTDLERSFWCPGDIAIKVDIGDKRHSIPPKTRSSMAPWVMPTINKLKDLRTIFNYEFFINGRKGEDLLRKMNPCEHFKWEIPTVTGAPALPNIPRPPDSPIIRSLFPSLREGSSQTVLSSRKAGTGIKTSGYRKRRLVTPLQSTQRRESKYRMDANHYIQKAWANAVETDSTFIVFSCGGLERIGIRHRQSQTLYLSDLIDPVQLKEPAYCQMHLGLVLASMKDHLAMLDRKETSNARLLRRKEPSADFNSYNSMKDKATRRKRRKLNPNEALNSLEMDKKVFDEELSKRDLFLFYLNYGNLRSPAPSSFRRMEASCVSQPFRNQPYQFKRKAFYTTEDYISVTANQDYIGQGAVGLVYRVTVEIEFDSGSKHRRRLILKLALGDKKEQIVQEYGLYKRLAENGVTYGIVGVHGLFHDMETGAMIMIMDDAGISLRTRAIQQSDEIYEDTLVKTTEEERDTYVKILEGIHGAHIIHHDLRIDNLMINEEGDVFIIDFDSGEYDLDHAPYDYKDDMSDLIAVIGWRLGDSDDEDNDEDYY